MKRIGFITGLRCEAHCLAGFERVALSGANAERARLHAQTMIDQGCDGLVSFGLAGGLCGDVRRGDVILPEKIVTYAQRVFDVDRAWRTDLADGLETMNPHSKPLLGSDTALLTPAEKADAHKRYDAVAVDMESHAVAAVAREAKVPFVVVRVVADACERTVPRWAFECVDADGRTQIAPIIKGLIGAPHQVVTMIGLGVDTAVALRSLRRVAAVFD